MANNTATIQDGVIIVERIFDAPRELVWQAWTTPEHFKNWYGPQGFSVPIAQMDVRVGGKHLFCMESPDGSMKLWSTGEYTEVIPHERLVYTDSISDEHGNITSPSAMGMGDDYPTTTEVTVMLEDLGGRTKMTMKHAGLPSNAQGANAGWEQAFTKMTDYLKILPNVN